MKTPNLKNRKSIIKISMIALLTVLSSVFIPQQFIQNTKAATTITWDGGGDGVTWSDPLNWNTDAVPTTTDEVLIDTATTVQLTGETQITALIVGKSDGSVASILEFTYTATTSGTPLNITGDLTVHTGSKITHTAATAEINLLVGGSVTIDGDIDAAYKGYPHGQGPGQGGDEAGAGGGSHAGDGGISEVGILGGTVVYGSYSEPITYGSGGGLSNASQGAGGGTIKMLITGNLTVNGNISSDGQDGHYWYQNSSFQHGEGGGAGGSVWINATTISGTGTVSAQGGGTVLTPASYGKDGGAGGGGRIAMYYTTNSLALTQISTAGGIPGRSTGQNQNGGAGTIYLKQSSATNGDLIIDNKNTTWQLTNPSRNAYTQLTEDISINNLYIKNLAKVKITGAITTSGETKLENIHWFEYATNTIQKTAYIPDDWNTEADGSGTAYTYAEVNTLTETVASLYMQWTALEYTITFDINNSESGSAPISITQTGGSDVDLPTQGDLAKTEYSFQGWNTAANGSGTLYEEEETISMPTQDTTLYATWLQTYIYESNGTGTVKITDYNGKTETTVILPTTLGGDTVTELDTNSFWQSTIETLTIPSNITVIGQNAFYGSQISSLTLHDNITSIGQDAFRSNNINSVTLPTNLETIGQGAFNDNALTNITIPGNITVIPPYTFANNSLTEVALNEALEEIGANAFSTNQLTTIILPTNILTIGDDAFRYNAGLTSITLPEIEGYTTTWTDSGVGTYNGGDNITDFTIAYTGIKEINTYTISFNSNSANGGSTPYTITGDYNELATISNNSLIKTGHTLTGWNTSANGSGTGYTTKQSFNIPAEDLVLYAQWEINEYTLSFEGEGSNLPSDLTEDYNTMVGAPSSTPTRVGYTFTGWNTLANGTGISYDPGDTFRLTEDTTLYSQWNLIPVVTEEPEEEEESTEKETVEEITEPIKEEPRQELKVEVIQINGEFQDNEKDHIVIDEVVEEIEIEIPVQEIIGELNHEEVDEVVIKIEEEEYVMKLSEDKKTYIASIRIPEVKGEYTIEIVAEKDGEEISNQSISLVIEEKNNTMMFVYILTGIIVIAVGTAIVIKRRN